MIDDVLKDIPIKPNDSIFELGCGTAAVLKRIRQVYGSNINIGGSDISFNAIEVAKKIFSKDSGNFYVISMTEKNNAVPDNSQDVVISFGAFAMYLYKSDMELALIEALRYLHSVLFDKKRL
jgi:ubiquinone/menaquinone biosynthesis C-methylase UbiE